MPPNVLSPIRTVSYIISAAARPVMVCRETWGSSTSYVSSRGLSSSMWSRKMPFIRQTFKCSYENCGGQLKHSFFSRLAAISAGVTTLKARCCHRSPTRCGASSSRGLLTTWAGTDLARAERSPAMASHCSYTRAKAMASSSMVGCSSSMSVRSGLCRPTVKMLICCFSVRSS
jgi:hypothetical protein